MFCLWHEAGPSSSPLFFVEGFYLFPEGLGLAFAFEFPSKGMFGGLGPGGIVVSSWSRGLPCFSPQPL